MTVSQKVHPGNALFEKRKFAVDRCQVYWLGRIDYWKARAIQERLAAARSEGQIPDTLLLLEHPPVYTLGRRGNDTHLLVSRQELANQGVAVLCTDRGGDVTFHGPGQLVGYPVISLKHRHGGLGAYLRDLEHVLIQALSEFAVSATRVPGFTGVWVNDKKIAAIGIKVNAGKITGHGFALNVNTDLGYFSNIIPCGIVDKGITSMAAELGCRVSLGRVARGVVKAFSRVFDKTMEQGVPEVLLASLNKTPQTIQTGKPGDATGKGL